MPPAGSRAVWSSGRKKGFYLLPFDPPSALCLPCFSPFSPLRPSYCCRAGLAAGFINDFHSIPPASLSRRKELDILTEGRNDKTPQAIEELRDRYPRKIFLGRRVWRMEIKKIGVLGAGAMGNGIAQVCAQAGHTVVMRDIADKFVQRGLKTIEGFLAKSVEKGKITEDEKKKVVGRIKGTTEMADLKECDFIIEAVLEELALKKQVFQEVEKLTRPEVILATNTSSMSITAIGAATKRADKVVGMHFFNPVPLMRLGGGIKGIETSDETASVTKQLSEKLGKGPVRVKRDAPGFVVNP